MRKVVSGREFDTALVAFVVGLASFLLLAILYVSSSRLSSVDLAVAGGLHRVAVDDPNVTSGFLVVTALGNGLVLTSLTVLAVGWLVAVRRRVLALGVAVSMAGVGAIDTVLKVAFQRARPTFRDPVAVADGWSFPSGHSMGTIVAGGMLAYIAFHWVEAPTPRRILVAAVTLWVLLMGFSRMVLGVHYLSDVAAGLAAGTAWLALSIKVIETVEARQS